MGGGGAITSFCASKLPVPRSLLCGRKISWLCVGLTFFYLKACRSPSSNSKGRVVGIGVGMLHHDGEVEGVVVKDDAVLVLCVHSRKWVKSQIDVLLRDPPQKKNNTRSANEEISPLNCMLSFSSDDQKCRFRDDVLPDFKPPAGSGAFFNSFTSDPRRGGYRGRYASGV